MLEIKNTCKSIFFYLAQILFCWRSFLFNVLQKEICEEGQQSYMFILSRHWYKAYIVRNGFISNVANV